MNVKTSGKAKIEHARDNSYETILWSSFGINGDIKYTVEFRDENGYFRASRGNSFSDITDYDTFVMMLETATNQNIVSIIK